MLFLLCSCSVLDKITTNIEDKPTDETTKAPVGDEVPTVKYKRSDLKYTFLTLVEGFEEGVPAQVSYSVFDTSANTLSTVLIPLNTFVSGENKSLGAQIKSYYFSKASEGRSAAIAAATSRVRRSTRRAARGISSICSGAVFLAPTRQASVPKRLCG